MVFSRKTLPTQTRPSADFQVPLSDDRFIQQLVHLHASRNGPTLANELYLALTERRRHPNLKEIIGVVQPNAPIAKFLDYWTSGLSDQATHQVFKGLAASLRVPSLCDLTLLALPASSKVVQWDEFVDAIARPLLGDGRNTAILEDDIERVASEKGPAQLTLEDAWVSASGQLANLLLRRNGLPTIRHVKLNDEQLQRYATKSVVGSVVSEMSVSKLERFRNRAHECQGLLTKQLKAIRQSRPATLKDVERCHIRLSKPGSAYKAAAISIDYMTSTCLEPAELQASQGRNSNETSADVHAQVLETRHKIDAVVDAVGTAIVNVPNEGYPYVDGMNMIAACFAIAQSEGCAIALQEFIRDDNAPYNQYERMHGVFPDVPCVASAARVWDTTKFPEFDQNLVTATCYLPREHEVGLTTSGIWNHQPELQSPGLLV